jgi:hypothetical protein
MLLERLVVRTRVGRCDLWSQVRAVVPKQEETIATPVHVWSYSSN